MNKREACSEATSCQQQTNQIPSHYIPAQSKAKIQALSSLQAHNMDLVLSKPYTNLAYLFIVPQTIDSNIVARMESFHYISGSNINVFTLMCNFLQTQLRDSLNCLKSLLPQSEKRHQVQLWPTVEEPYWRLILALMTSS